MFISIPKLQNHPYLLRYVYPYICTLERHAFANDEDWPFISPEHYQQIYTTKENMGIRYCHFYFMLMEYATVES